MAAIWSITMGLLSVGVALLSDGCLLASGVFMLNVYVFCFLSRDESRDRRPHITPNRGVGRRTLVNGRTTGDHGQADACV